jgi:hypothetical protein
MTISNLSSNIHQRPSMYSVVMDVLLPIPIKNRNLPQKRLDVQRQTNRDLQTEVLRWILNPHRFKPNPSAKSRNYNILCAAGNFRHWKPLFLEWLAD